MKYHTDQLMASGTTFNPASPLIIKNGGSYAKKIMKINIPLTIPDGHFAMAFFYDETRGELQGFTVVKQEQDMLTVVTKHFSEIVVTSIAKSRLEGEIESEFKHGVDNWQFVNNGSYIVPMDTAPVSPLPLCTTFQKRR